MSSTVSMCYSITCWVRGCGSEGSSGSRWRCGYRERGRDQKAVGDTEMMSFLTFYPLHVCTCYVNTHMETFSMTLVMFLLLCYPLCGNVFLLLTTMAFHVPTLAQWSLCIISRYHMCVYQMCCFVTETNNYCLLLFFWLCLYGFLHVHTDFGPMKHLKMLRTFDALFARK